MARKGKDLFVMLAERHEARRQPESERSSASKASKASKASPKSKARDDRAGRIGGELGIAVGRWVRGVARTLGGGGGGGAAGGGTARRPPRQGSSPAKRGVRQVPRGLLLPGWLLAGIAVGALGCGFFLGRVTHGGVGDRELSRDGVQQPGKLDPGGPGYLGATDEEQVLCENFFVVRIYSHPTDRAAAARLAQELRARDLHSTRIQEFWRDGSFFCWATLCYVAPSSDQEAILRDLRRFEAELGYETDQVLRAPERNTPTRKQ